MPVKRNRKAWKPNLLIIVPPYMMGAPPAGAAALLGYLKARGCRDFDFLDLRLWAPAFPFSPMDHAPTFRYTGLFAENYVVDIPDLPLVLELLNAHRDRRRPLIGPVSRQFSRYCRERLRDPEWLKVYLSRMEHFLRAALNQVPDLRFVGFSVWPSNYLTTLLASAILKERPSPPFIVAGGAHVTESVSAAKLGLESGLFDAVACGEGEVTLFELYEQFHRGQVEAINQIPGVLALTGEDEFEVRERQLLKLSELPLPSYEPMNLNAYSPSRRTINFELSRGCINKCSFCSEWVFWRHFRSISPDLAAERITTLASVYDAKHVSFTDSLVNEDPGRLERFAELLVRQDPDFEWSAYMRADVDDRMADLLFRAGLRYAFIGVESLDDRTLTLMEKSRSREDNIRSVKVLLERGVAVELGIIPGFPGDTCERFTGTVGWISRLMQEYPAQLSTSLAPFILTPAQPIFHALETYGLKTESWDTEYLDITPELIPITEKIPCTVSGPNQGVDRLGQMNLLEFTVAQGRAYGARLCKVPPTYARKVSIWHVSLDSSQFKLTGVCPGWYLGFRVSSEGSICGLIMSEAELQEFNELRRRAAADFPELIGKDELPRELFSDFFREVERTHVLAPSELPRLSKFCGLTTIEPDRPLAVSPHAVARVVQTDGGEKLFAANLVSVGVQDFPSAVGSVLEYIKSHECTVREVESFAAEKIGFSIGDWKSIQNTLLAFGVLIAHP